MEPGGRDIIGKSQAIQYGPVPGDGSADLLGLLSTTGRKPSHQRTSSQVLSSKQVRAAVYGSGVVPCASCIRIK